MTTTDWILLGVLALVLWLLLRWLMRRWREAQAEAAQKRAVRRAAQRQFWQAQSQAQAAEAAKAAERYEVKQAKALEGLTQADPMLLDFLAREMRVAPGEVRELVGTPEGRRKLVRQCDEELLTIVQVANEPHTDFSEIKLENTIDRNPVPYATDDLQPELLTDYSRLPEVFAAQQALDDDQFYLELAQQQLGYMQPYEPDVRRRRLYILLDVSGSMDEAMPDGRTRKAWAAGVTAHLLIRAMAGEAAYLLRAFNDRPRELLRALSRSEAEAILSRLPRMSVGGGTDIPTALRQAAKDIRTSPDDIGTSDILLITDGACSMQQAFLKKLLGDDIRLHSALIGAPSETLKKVSTTYHVYR